MHTALSQRTERIYIGRPEPHNNIRALKRCYPGTPRPIRISFFFRRREEDQDFELLLDVVEPMLQIRLDENDRSGAHRCVVRADLHAGASADDIVHLILAVRFLRIARTLRQNVDAGAHSGYAEKFQVRFGPFASLAEEIVDVKVMRHKVKCRTRKERQSESPPPGTEN
jgi:hypothetical protein